MSAEWRAREDAGAGLAAQASERADLRADGGAAANAGPRAHAGVQSVCGAVCTLIEIVFPVMALAPVLPMFMMMLDGREDAMLPRFYAAAFVLLVPTAAAKLSIWRVKSLGVYLAVCAGALALTYGLAVGVSGLLLWTAGTVSGTAAALGAAGTVSGTAAALGAAGTAPGAGGASLLSPAVFIASVMIEAVVILFVMFLVRMNEAGRVRAARENDLTWSGHVYLLEQPSYLLLVWFAALYGLGLLFVCPSVCDIAAWSFLIYGAMACFYRHVDVTDAYLLRLNYISHMPARRIRTIGLAMLLIFLAAAAVFGAAASALTANSRRYFDFRKWQSTLEVDISDIGEIGGMGQADAAAMFSELAEEGDWQPNPILDAFAYVLLAAVAALVVYGCYRILKGVFAEFRDTRDENGDISVSLENGDRAQRIAVRGRARAADTERERVRREYRRAIRRARKEAPRPSETPDEIERAAGLAEDAAMRKLHKRYEKARYDG